METHMLPPQEARTMTREGAALAEIEAIKAEITATGAHDNSELEALTGISAAVAAGTMTPKEGVARARTLQRSRQDDH